MVLEIFSYPKDDSVQLSTIASDFALSGSMDLDLVYSVVEINVLVFGELNLNFVDYSTSNSFLHLK